MNPVEFLIFAAALDLVQTMRFAFFTSETALAAFSVVETGSLLLAAED